MTMIITMMKEKTEMIKKRRCVQQTSSSSSSLDAISFDTSPVCCAGGNEGFHFLFLVGESATFSQKKKKK
jgi:hypothetical protein